MAGLTVLLIFRMRIFNFIGSCYTGPVFTTLHRFFITLRKETPVLGEGARERITAFFAGSINRLNRSNTLCFTNIFYRYSSRGKGSKRSSFAHLHLLLGDVDEGGK